MAYSYWKHNLFPNCICIEESTLCLPFLCFVEKNNMMSSVAGLLVICVVLCVQSEAESDGRGKALTQSDADAICSVVKELRGLRNNLTQNMLVAEKIVDNGKKIVLYYSERIEGRKILVDVLKKVMTKGKSSFGGTERLLENMGKLNDELGNTITRMNASLWTMRLPSWNLVNMSDSYAYWVKDMVESFAHAALSTLSCCLVVNGGATGDCTKNGQRGSVPRDCTTYPPQRIEGSLAEYENPLDKELTLTMGNAGNYRNHVGYGCYITTTNSSYIRGRKSLIYELSGGLFNTSENALISNFSSIGEEFQHLIGQLNANVGMISAGNTSITGQKATLDSLFLKLEEEVRSILKGRETTMELTEKLGTMKDIPWYDKESNVIDGVKTKPNLSGVTMLLFVFVVFGK
ncbi:ESAG11-related protein, putative [Trypanosoma brucei gambiense DAL972]|uniref:Uncharacterized protein n=2 Tax=Trypanosoma brucei TaxID=5691 RepID=C9ZMX4_TRYB9|nr:ESAG11-related protein, putative [Trypanosoma brucei gambiense DAL972]RHW73136.1 ESAG11-related protein [Trypanosoma brucei equiperdum]CBH10627.1 ESAG11-related protein, putative [Trypanosoma brucei gambiense DAL972]|eukprot:XP_011772916.1 ESAG11-related protein, putative [Trypanosoma brucei gambiense DAL972]